MQPGLFSIIKAEVSIWRVSILPEIALIWLRIFTRIISVSQSLKLLVFDKLFHWRTKKCTDPKIIRVDIHKENRLKQLINDGKSQTYQPRLFGLAIVSLLIISYVLLIWGWWIPVIPAMLILIINCMQIMALYQYDQALKLGMGTRQSIIESTFETIHNGPLQSLAKVLKLVKSQDINTQELLPQIEKELEKLNYELRGIYEFLQQEYPSQDIKLYLGNNLVLNLQDPLHEVLYQVYSYTLERDFPCFKTVKVAIRSFDPIDERHLSIEQKRGICRFLEEALCNVGKHATGVSKLQVTCSLIQGWYTLKIIDNGSGANLYKKGRGTQQSINLAQQLQGKFERSPVFPQGTICKLSWRVANN
nr:hypothetical protein [Anabaena subtropica]